jgi:hypothetical protein
MSDTSNDLRRKAARKLRTSRLSGLTDDERDGFKREAAGYKAMAHNEEWLGGTPQRSRKRKSKKGSPGYARS